MDEVALIAAAQSGDHEAFNELVVEYQRLAYNVAYRVLGNGDAAEDATQDAFLSAYRAIRRVRGGAVKTWVVRIVTNACYDQLRAKKRRPETSLDADPESDWAEWVGDDQEQPEEHAERQELGQVIQRGLDALPPEQRMVVVLSDIQGLKYDQVATTMGISLGTVKSRLNRGRRKLRDFLQENMELLPSRYRLYNETGGITGTPNVLAEWISDRLYLRLLRRGVNRYD
jgi:RNA polymerase sigma-70 factor (ECF subfamily)